MYKKDNPTYGHGSTFRHRLGEAKVAVLQKLLAVYQAIVGRKPKHP